MKHNKITSKYLFVTLLNIVITISEFLGGILSGSLALLSDAVHNLSDVAAIIISFVAHLIGQRDRDKHKTFGYQRAETLAAFTNGVVLLVVSFLLMLEAFERFTNPQPVKGRLMLIIALIGLLANGVSMLVMSSGAKHNLNVRATFLHMMSDALSSIAVVIGAVIIYFWKSNLVDPLMTLLVSIFIMFEAYKITKKAANILMESNPNVDLEEIKKIVLSFPEVTNLHHLHVWRYSDDFIMMDAHVNVTEKMSVIQLEQLYSKIGQELKTKLGINHVTLQAECQRGIKEKMIVLNKDD
ncbi:cation diffusion facilitator family transporter [Lactobacillus psittaci]|uniref:Cation efflux protein n=1 Tax=Lactobacillus psittaci DSM 15354 TaxID=1122152 RepID=A0A0R1S8X5_9LACO|nr:cation diffusion facilitator family transporter [Lactobacillus psittaci]KRL63138.1 cation efflux protein [Lactobacillus psittaci DSM 15354]